MQILFGHRGDALSMTGSMASTRHPFAPWARHRHGSSPAGNSATTPMTAHRWQAACTGWWNRPADSCGASPWPPVGSAWFWSTPTASAGSVRPVPDRPRPTIFHPVHPCPAGAGSGLDPAGPAAAHDPRLRPLDLSAGPTPVVRIGALHGRKQDRLVTAMDRIRDRFGTDALAMGRTLAA
jgi:hypothetical protein